MEYSIPKFWILLVLCALSNRINGEEDDIDTSDIQSVEEDKGVLIITEKNHDYVLEKYPHLLIKLYAPWCGHCKALAPEFEKLAKTLHENSHVAKLAKIDATVETKLGEKYKIEGYPTLKYIENQKVSEYEGPREAEGMLKWLDRRTGEPTKDWKEMEEVEKIIEEGNDVIVVGFFKNYKSPEAKIFRDAARENEKQYYIMTRSPHIHQEYGRPDGSVMIIRQFDERLVDYEGKMTAEDINAWVSVQSLRLVNKFSVDTASDLLDVEVKGHLFFFIQASGPKLDQKKLDAALKELSETCKDLRGKLVCVYFDIEEDDSADIIEFMDRTKEDAPFSVIFNVENSTKFHFDKKLIAQEMRPWIQNYLKGDLSPDYKKQELPKDWNKKPLKVLVDDNYQSVTSDETKDVLVEFTAPWCEECKKIDPMVEKLAEDFEDREDILIAKIDVVENERIMDLAAVEDFPSFRLYKKGKASADNFVDYKGARELELLTKFLNTGEQDPLPEDEQDKMVEVEEIDENEEMDDNVKTAPQHIEL